MTATPLLEVQDLSIWFDDHAPVIQNLNLEVFGGEVMAVIGASGSGKSLLAHSVLGLFAHNATVTGAIRFDGRTLSLDDLVALRGSQITLVPQTVTSLDPLMKVGRQILGPRSDSRRRARMSELLDRYELDQSVAGLYPFELSGGMIRRVILVAALINEPRLIVADEPTPGMHSELARLAMADLRAFADGGRSVLLITHEVELAIEVADRIAVYRSGTTLETAPTSAFIPPVQLQHPYSRALLRALPSREFSP
ncbi:MAG: ATP-binding cassette domain-containing protein [Brooklawnia sp.]|jgi:peptide/nickel transport system ATP-binding protein